MKILLIMDPGIPVPPQHYGGHERLVYLFAEEYAKLGHEVTLLAGPGSFCSGTTVTFGRNGLHRSKFAKKMEIAFVWYYLLRHKSRFELIHNFGRLIYLLPILNYAGKKIMTYGRAVSGRGIRLVESIPNRNLVFTACSDYCVSTGNVAGTWKTVYNAIDFSKYQLREETYPDAPLMFLGRLDKIKGVHSAIQVAKATGHRLLIGGNMPDTADNLAYFHEEVEPLIDQERVVYLGPLTDEQKNEYLGQAKALLFPIEWDEPFGLVMIEAMACGTPVIALKRGSVPEVVETGLTGFICEDLGQMAKATKCAEKLNRQACRLAAEHRFSAPVIAQAYLSL